MFQTDIRQFQQYLSFQCGSYTFYKVKLKSNISLNLQIYVWNIAYTKDSNIDSYIRKTANNFVGDTVYCKQMSYDHPPQRQVTLLYSGIIHLIYLGFYVTPIQ